MRSKKTHEGSFSPALQRVTAPPRGRRRPPARNDPQAKLARKLLRDAYRIYEPKGRGGWRAVAKRFGLKGPAQAMLMAEGQRPICERMRAVAKMNGKIFFRRFIRKTVVPFLEERQTKSKSGVYGNDGKPVSKG